MQSGRNGAEGVGAVEWLIEAEGREGVGVTSIRIKGGTQRTASGAIDQRCTKLLPTIVVSGIGHDIVVGSQGGVLVVSAHVGNLAKGIVLVSPLRTVRRGIIAGKLLTGDIAVDGQVEGACEAVVGEERSVDPVGRELQLLRIRVDGALGKAIFEGDEGGARAGEQ